MWFQVWFDKDIFAGIDDDECLEDADVEAAISAIKKKGGKIMEKKPEPKVGVAKANGDAESGYTSDDSESEPKKAKKAKTADGDDSDSSDSDSDYDMNQIQSLRNTKKGKGTWRSGGKEKCRYLFCLWNNFLMLLVVLESWLSLKKAFNLFYCSRSESQ